jgi:hypothetical protein
MVGHAKAFLRVWEAWRRYPIGIQLTAAFYLKGVAWKELPPQKGTEEGGFGRGALCTSSEEGQRRSPHLQGRIPPGNPWIRPCEILKGRS